MLDIKYIINHVDEVKDNCLRRKADPELVTNAIIHYTNRKELMHCRDGLVHQQRMLGKKRDENMAGLRVLSGQVKELDKDINEEEVSLRNCMVNIPNLTHPEVSDTVQCMRQVIRPYWKPDNYPFKPKTHIELAEGLDIVDFNAAAKVTGSKFYYLKNEGVLLENALVQFALHKALENGFTIWQTPDIATNYAIEAMGFSPHGEASQIYNLAGTNQSMIGTAEITLGGIHADETITTPLRYAGISHCFRKEAGAPGKENKGLYRVHQFTKVELFVFCMPQDSDRILDEILALEEEIYCDLDLTYQVLDIQASELGNPAYRKYDIEVWMPGRNEWGEVTSCSNCTDYQSRRLNTRCNKEFVHTLNGTAIAVPRTILAILETFQQEDGSVIIPPKLRPYLKMDILRKKNDKVG